MTDIFISYKRENLGTVESLVRGLREAGLSVWWDQDIAADAPWESTIEDELAAAKVVIVAWSRAAVASENVKAEARRARTQGKLIQVYVEACEPPLFFGERQGVDLDTWNGAVTSQKFQSIVAAVRAILAGERPSPSGGDRVRRQGRKLEWLVPLIAVVLSLGAMFAVVSNLAVVGNAVCSVSWFGAACGHGEQELSVEITSPTNGSNVASRHEILGIVSDPNAEVWVLLSPLMSNECWVQPRAVVRANEWAVNAYFGGPRDEGARYTLRAIANPERQMHPGRTEDCWPPARAESAPVLNLARGQ